MIDSWTYLALSHLSSLRVPLACLSCFGLETAAALDGVVEGQGGDANDTENGEDEGAATIHPFP